MTQTQTVPTRLPPADHPSDAAATAPLNAEPPSEAASGSPLFLPSASSHEPPLRTSAPSEPTTTLDMPAVNVLLDARTPRQIVDWAASEFGDSLLLTSSFGAESAVMLHLVTRAMPGIRVVLVDTGYLFPQTLGFVETLRERMNLNLHVYRTNHDPAGYLREAGETDPNWRKDVERCCGQNKNAAFDQAMHTLRPAGWLRGIRRDQADTRKSRQIVEWSARNRCYAISPLLNWTGREIGMYMHQHDLPYHPLVDQGYLSIGCSPESCTRPVHAGQDPRAGRWAQLNKTECGLHVDAIADPAKQ